MGINVDFHAIVDGAIVVANNTIENLMPKNTNVPAFGYFQDILKSSELLVQARKPPQSLQSARVA